MNDERAALLRQIAVVSPTASPDDPDWSKLAAFANYAQALGLQDPNMLELSADLNVEIAMSLRSQNDAQAASRLLRAKSLLEQCAAARPSPAALARYRRKQAEVEALLAADSARGGAHQ
ncbi:MAG: hypothetical protein U0625_12660 [Phycisphaerales bacterium]